MIRFGGKFERIRVKIPFGFKLMISYCVFIIIPVLLVGNIANQVFIKSIREQTYNNIQGTLHQMSDNISYKMEDIVRVSDMLYFDSSFNNRLRYSEYMGKLRYDGQCPDSEVGNGD